MVNNTDTILFTEVVFLNSLHMYINIGIIFSIILGTLLHFTYQLSNSNKIVGYFSAINESIWEHTKLAVFPINIATVIIYSLLGESANNLFPALAIGAVLPIIIIPSIFYFYVSFTKHPIFPLDITIFLISVIVTLKVIEKILLLPQVNLTLNLLSVIIFIFTISSIFSFTYNPPNLKLFKEGSFKLYIK